MRNENVFAIILVGVLAWIGGFILGGQYERNKFSNRIEGDSWEIRWKDGTYPPNTVQKSPRDNENTRVRVWPFVDVETNPQP